MPVDLSERPLQSSAPAHLQTYDIVIVGGGIVGLTCACALRESGLRVAVIEAQSAEQAASRQRAYAFSPVSANILKGLELWEVVGAQLTPFEQVKLSDAGYGKAITFRPENGRSDAVYYSAEHTVLMSALQSAVAAASDIDYWCESKILDSQVSPQGSQLSVGCGGREYVFHTRLLVGADGARSAVRDRAHIKTLGWQYWQSCITAVLAPEKSHEYTAYERFWPSGPFAILPLPNNLCQIVWTAPHAEAKALLALPKEQFLAELQARYGNQMGRLTLVNEPTLFPVQLMQSRDYVRAGVALIGDAAHCCHPVGGQGLNMGIRDAVALAEVLVQAAQAGEDWSSLKVLKRYERWRKRENWFTLSLTDFLNRAFSNRFWPLVIARRLGIWLLDSIGPLKRLILQLMTGFFGKLPSKAK
jgi:2-octaprenyl-6-methoxyphenol hydroxylase